MGGEQAWQGKRRLARDGCILHRSSSTIQMRCRAASMQATARAKRWAAPRPRQCTHHMRLLVAAALGAQRAAPGVVKVAQCRELAILAAGRAGEQPRRRQASQRQPPEAVLQHDRRLPGSREFLKGRGGKKGRQQGLCPIQPPGGQRRRRRARGQVKAGQEPRARHDRRGVLSAHCASEWRMWGGTSPKHQEEEDQWTFPQHPRWTALSGAGRRAQRAFAPSRSRGAALQVPERWSACIVTAAWSYPHPQGRAKGLRRHGRLLALHVYRYKRPCRP